MPFQLILTIEYRSDTEWRWVLTDKDGRFIQDHEVELDPSKSIYKSFEDLPRQLRHYEDVQPAEEILAELGAWMGTNIFGKVGEELLKYEQSPACVIQVRAPHAAQALLFRPFELAHIDGTPMAERGFRLVYTVKHDRDRRPGRKIPKEAVGETLRMLGVFSLPADLSPLNLRRERYRLQGLVRNFALTHGKAVELRLLQYGATRQLLKAVLEESPGWDLIHFSGHGQSGELILEKPDGSMDRIAAEDLTSLLKPAGARLKLLMLSACYSGAADLRTARAQIGLANPPLIEPTRKTAAAPSVAALPSLGQRIAEEMDCAVLAMRYPVLDDFATEMALELYKRMLESKQPLPQALQLAIAHALEPDRDPQRPGFSRVTPVLFGGIAADLRFQPPARAASFAAPETGLHRFPNPPERFVGRLKEMLHAREVIALESSKTGMLFYGMAGAGKTACALELAHGYDRRNVERFTGFVWHSAPKENHDIADALTQFALSMETQLPKLELVGLMDDPRAFAQQALPALRAVMGNNAILVVLDNLEGLLTSDGEWRDERWGALLNALLDHNGPSRVVLTSRRLPVTLAGHARLQADSIHALSFQESLILGRELPRLKTLFKDEAQHGTLQRILKAAQGHPKLMELADGLAADPAALDEHLARVDSAAVGAGPIAFFESGESGRDEDHFVRELRVWTEGVARNLGPAAGLLAQFLAGMEDADRTDEVVERNWEDFLKRLTGESGETSQPAPEPLLTRARSALTESGLGLEAALNQLSQAGLIEIETTTTLGEPRITEEALQTLLPTLLPILGAENQEVAALLANPEGVTFQDVLPHLQSALSNPSDAVQAWLQEQRSPITTSQFRIHPGVAEALLLSSPPAIRHAVDTELGDYFVAVFRHGIKTEMEGGGRLVVEGARRAAPYLMRAELWQETSTLLEWMIARDTRPATLALAIHLLRQIVEKTNGTERELIDAGVLASALRKAGRYGEAETAMRDLIVRCVERRNYRLASAEAGDLFNLLSDTSRFEEALKTAEEKADYTRRAGLGPWSHLGDEVIRLQALNAIGRYDDVLAAVEQHLAAMKDLPEESKADETVDPWNVREGLLDTGHAAAMRLERWETTLALNSECIASMHRRGADEVEIALVRFNDHKPYLGLGGYPEARALLNSCREVFERANAVYGLGLVYSALAELEYREGNPESAVRFEQAALRYRYQSGRPEDCAISHNNLPYYVQRSADIVLAHHLAAAVILYQISSGQLSISIRNLSLNPLPAEPPSFGEVCAIVEQILGVRFAEMFAQLPKKAPDGDAAIQIVWNLALKAKEAKNAKKE